MEISARLVNARALLGKWQSGLQEVRAAREARDADTLSAALEKWSFAEDDPEIVGARADLTRWRTLSEALPAVLTEAVEAKDIEQIREAMSALGGNRGPKVVDGLEDAKTMLQRYESQVKALDDAVLECSDKGIQQALQAWDFDSNDEHVLAAQGALWKRETQRAAVQAAIAAQDGLALQRACDDWDFDRADPDYLEARQALEGHARAQEELQRLTKAPGEVAAISVAINAWTYSKDDPIFKLALQCRQDHEDAARAAMEANDGWRLQHLWQLADKGSAWASSDNLYEEAGRFLQRYNFVAGGLKLALQHAESYTLSAERELVRHVEAWSFCQGDPNCEAAALWLNLTDTLERKRLRALSSIIASGHVAGIRATLRRVRHTREEQLQVKAAEDACASYEAALQACGALALGTPPEKLRVAAERLAHLEAVAKDLRQTVAALDAAWLTQVRGQMRPNRIVHGLFEMVMLVTAGLNPNVRDPPRDTDWRSCQRMLSDVPTFHSSLALIPEWLESGHIQGVVNASETANVLSDELGRAWSFEGARAAHWGAACLYRYLEHVFAYAELVESMNGQEDFEDVEEDSVLGERKMSAEVSESSMHAGHIQAHITEGNESASADEAEASASASRSNSRPVSTKESAAARLSPEDCLREPMERLTEPLYLLRGARQSLCSSQMLAAAWVVAGGDRDELAFCREHVRVAFCEAQGAAAADVQVLNALSRSVKPYRHTQSLRQRMQHQLSQQSESPGLPGPPSEADAEEDAESLGQSEQLSEIEEELPASPTSSPTSPNRRASEEGRRMSSRSSAVEDNARQSSRRQSVPSLKDPNGHVLQMLQSAVVALSHCHQEELTRRAPDGRMVGEAAAYLVSGMGGDEFFNSTYKSNLKSSMLEILRICMRIVRGGAGTEETAGLSQPWVIRLAGEPTHLNDKMLRSLRVPQFNLAASRRSLADSNWSGQSAAVTMAVSDFVEAMHAFYTDFVTQRASSAAASAAAASAETALIETDAVLNFAASLSNMVELSESRDLAGVEEASKLAASQAGTLAERGLALPALHVEHARNAVDSAGLALLSAPPASDPGVRLRWAEAAMAIQLAPLPHFVSALGKVARVLDPSAFQELAAKKGTPNAECVRLIAAVIWIVDPECRRNTDWNSAKKVLSTPRLFLEKLVHWNPERDASDARLARANDLLLEVWGWVSGGCSGNMTLCRLFAWASLATALRPFVEMGKRLAPVHRELQKGIARVDKAAPEQLATAKAKAWTVALFLLDGPGEAWWWLGLIRPARLCEPPWTDGEDGGVGASSGNAGEEDDLSPILEKRHSVVSSIHSPVHSEGHSSIHGSRTMLGTLTDEDLGSMDDEGTSGTTPVQTSTLPMIPQDGADDNDDKAEDPDAQAEDPGAQAEDPDAKAGEPAALVERRTFDAPIDGQLLEADEAEGEADTQEEPMTEVSAAGEVAAAAAAAPADEEEEADGAGGNAA